MNFVWRSLLIGVLAILVMGGQDPALAHGDKPHGEPEQTVIKSSAAETEIEEAPQAQSAEAEHDQSVVAQSSSLDVLTTLHPATVHFPIALLLLAAALEAIFMVRPNSGFEPTIRVVLYFAAGGTVIAVLFGWIHTGMWMGGEALMQRHRWVGTGLAIVSLVLAWLASRPNHRSRGLLRAVLTIAAVAVIFQGYWGAELSHGPDHLSPAH